MVHCNDGKGEMDGVQYPKESDLCAMGRSDERKTARQQNAYGKLVNRPIVRICGVVQKDLDIGGAVKPGGVSVSTRIESED